MNYNESDVMAANWKPRGDGRCWSMCPRFVAGEDPKCSVFGIPTMSGGECYAQKAAEKVREALDRWEEAHRPREETT